MGLIINDLNKIKNLEIFFRFSNFVFTFATLKTNGQIDLRSFTWYHSSVGRATD